MVQVKIEDSWKETLKNEFSEPYFQKLTQFVKQEKLQRTIYPPGADIFRAFNSTPFSTVKVVLIGQDPYHGPGQAHGLSFSVPRGVPLPPSLRNIYKELHADLGLDLPVHGDLSSWTAQGVLLLNAVLTVEHKKPGSHQNRGWEKFTNAAIQALQARPGLVYFLWGKYAQAKKEFINTTKNLVIESAHPSPFSAHRGFFGSKPFSKANAYLIEHGKEPIQWQIQ